MHLMRIGDPGAEKPVARLDDATYVFDPSKIVHNIEGLGVQRQRVLAPR